MNKKRMSHLKTVFFKCMKLFEMKLIDDQFILIYIYIYIYVCVCVCVCGSRPILLEDDPKVPF